MTPAEIKDKIIDIFENDSALTDFGIKKVFEGIRDSVKDSDYPHMVIEIEQNKDGVVRDVNSTVANEINFMIAGLVKDYKVDDQLDTILELETLIKKAICADITLSGKAVQLRFDTTTYDRQFWPIRAVIINCIVEYRQSFRTRN